MGKFNPPDPLNFNGNIREHWKRRKQELELYLVATEKDKKENKVKSSILVSSIEPQGREIYNTFSFSQEGESFDYNVIVQKFENVCIPRQNEKLLRYKFLTYKQKKGQSFNEFITQLKKFSNDCEFGELKNSVIKEIVVIGAIDDCFKERMLREPNLTFEKAIALGQSAEQTKLHAKKLKQEAGIYRAKSKIGICHPKKKIIKQCK